MRRTAKYYVDGIILVGIFLLPYCIYRYAQSLSPGMLATELPEMLCLLAICSVCRCMPIYLNKHHALDVSILAITTAVLLKGPYAATLLSAVSPFLTFEFDAQTGKHVHIYNIPIRKSAFNIANLMISILLPGLLLQVFGHTPGNVALPWMAFYMLIFTALSFLLNSFILFTMASLNGDMKPGAALATVKALIPNVLAAMPLGLLMCYVFRQDHGYWVALIMLLPLMLARYAWKLYLDAQKQQYRLIEAFTAAMEAKDKYTEGHSRRVGRYANLIAREMRLRPALIETIDMAATLHDIGKIGIPDSILLKPGRLDEDEFEAIKSHPIIGVNIVRQVSFSQEVMEIIRHHHERYDGAGYPDALDVSGLSLGAQILSVADTFDAMTSARPYRGAMPLDEALKRLIDEKGGQFNPDVVDCLVALAHDPEFEEVLRS